MARTKAAADAQAAGAAISRAKRAAAQLAEDLAAAHDALEARDIELIAAQQELAELHKQVQRGGLRGGKGRGKHVMHSCHPLPIGAKAGGRNSVMAATLLVLLHAPMHLRLDVTPPAFPPCFTWFHNIQLPHLFGVGMDYKLWAQPMLADAGGCVGGRGGGSCYANICCASSSCKYG